MSSRRLAALLGLILTACTSGGGEPPAAHLPVPTTAPAPVAPPAAPRIGEPFTLDGIRMTVLSVQDPFVSGAQLQAAPGNRLVSVRYEAVSLRAEPLSPADVPSLEVRDAAGNAYRAEHGRLSMVGGARVPGETPAGARMESNSVVEVPASATGLRAAFRSPAHPDQQAVVRLD